MTSKRNREEWEDEIGRFREAFGDPVEIDSDDPDDYLKDDINNIRNNESFFTELMLCRNEVRDLSDLAWELLGRYITRNTHLDEIQLSELWLDDRETDRETSLLFENWTGSSSLTNLYLDCNRFGLASIEKMVPLLKNCSNLTNLFLCQNDSINGECFRVVVEALNGSPIENLNFRCCNINDITALGYCNLPRLRDLDLNQNSIESIPSLENYTNLQNLSLNENNIQTIPSLENCTSLELLYLQRNEIGTEGCNAVAKLLQHTSSSLKSLHLENNAIVDEGAEILANALEHSTTLKCLCLNNDPEWHQIYGINIKSNNNIKEDGYRAFLKILNDVSSIKRTINSVHTLTELKLPSCSDSKSMELHNYITSALKINEENPGNPHAAARAKVIAFQLNSITRMELCRLQGIDYSYSTIFAGIEPVLLPKLLALVSREHGKSELYRMVIATAPDITSAFNMKTRTTMKE